MIADVVREARRVLPHVVCVDDGCHDEAARPPPRPGRTVVTHPVNLGQGAALQTGFEYALAQPGMRWVVTFDADGQHQTDDVLAMLEIARAGELDVVFGSRFLDDRTQAGWLKKLVLRLAVAYTNLTTQTRLTDAHNGLRLLSRRVVERLDITQNRMAHASEIVAQIGACDWMTHPCATPSTRARALHRLLRAKGQSLWNSVNILVELILR